MTKRYVEVESLLKWVTKSEMVVFVPDIVCEILRQSAPMNPPDPPGHGRHIVHDAKTR